MQPKLVGRRVPARLAATIRRLTVDGAVWRVKVEIWPVDGVWRGRLVFDPDGCASRREARFAPPTLGGRSREEAISSAHELTERRLRELFHSLA